MDGGAVVPHIQEPARNAADLSQTRRDHPRPRLLQLPRPGAEKGTGGPHRRHGRSRAMRVLARDPRRPRLADRDRGRTGRQAFRPALAAPPRRELGAARRRRRPAADRASAPRRLTRSRQLSPNVVPRRFSSADSCLRSKTCRFEVLKISQGAVLRPRGFARRVAPALLAIGAAGCASLPLAPLPSDATPEAYVAWAVGNASVVPAGQYE